MALAQVDVDGLVGDVVEHRAGQAQLMDQEVLAVRDEEQDAHVVFPGGDGVQDLRCAHLGEIDAVPLLNVHMLPDQAAQRVDPRHVVLGGDGELHALLGVVGVFCVQHVHLLQNALHLYRQAGSPLGQVYPAAAALENLKAELGLDVLDGDGDCGLGGVHLPRGLADGAGVDNRKEIPHLLDRHGASSLIFLEFLESGLSKRSGLCFYQYTAKASAAQEGGSSRRVPTCV